jgi:FkbM family methyltransferase
MPLPTAITRHTDRWIGWIPIRIRGGENEGLKWSLASAGGGYRSGRRASRQMAMLASLVEPGDVVWDVGAHHGYMTLCAARRVGGEGEVHAFEPSARSFEFLGRHVGWNDLDNVALHPFALGSYDGTASFGGSGSTKGYSLGGGSEEVRVRAAETLVACGDCPPPTFAKIDVEGSEDEVLAGAAPCLRPDTRILLAVHSREADRRCTEILTDLGFRVVPSKEAMACRSGDWSMDPDLLCFGPEYEKAERDVATVRALGF